jgi:hypothetical protein
MFSAHASRRQTARTHQLVVCALTEIDRIITNLLEPV